MIEGAKQPGRKQRGLGGERGERLLKITLGRRGPSAGLICLLVNEGENGDGEGMKGPFWSGPNKTPVEDNHNILVTHGNPTLK